MKRYKIFNSKEDADAAIPENHSILIVINSLKLSLSRHQGEFYATENSCPHQKESLSKGTINYLGEIICPLHEYRFNLKTGRECQMRTRDLVTYFVEINKDGLFVIIK
ncbi:MAG: Rieske 2Fe-2S domain-containing protein [Bacteroidota bacterium]